MSSSPHSEASSKETVPCWLSRLYKDDEFEEMDNAAFMTRLMPTTVRDIIWNITRDVMGAERAKIGFASQVCQILERYCAAFARAFRNDSASEWEVKKNLLKQKILLLIGVSLMLASKIDSSRLCVTTTSLKRFLERCGKCYTMRDINNAEWDLFEAIGYRIPLWTNVQKAQMFAVELAMPPRTIQAVGMYMNLVDLHLPTVHEKFKLQANDSPSPATSSEPGHSISSANGELRVRNMHLVAGVVLAASRFMRTSNTDLTLTSLAHWNRASVDYIRWIGDVLYKHLIDYVSASRGHRFEEFENDSKDAVKRRRHS